MFQTLKELPAHIGGIEWLEGEMVGVLFFGFCGLVILFVPFLDIGVSRGRPRRILNFLATLAVIYFIVMTARGLIK
jgi:quinol-cytochrome oxidoreductase complex cytochrome b subunit